MACGSIENCATFGAFAVASSAYRFFFSYINCFTFIIFLYLIRRRVPPFSLLAPFRHSKRH